MEDNPVWSPDGRQLAHHSWREAGDHVVEVVDLEGAGRPRVVYSESEAWFWPGSWSSQGWITVELLSDDGGVDIPAIRRDGAEEVLTAAGGQPGGWNSRYFRDG